MIGHTVNATDANRQFVRLLRDAQDGGRITITKTGRPVSTHVSAASEGFRASTSTLKRFDRLSAEDLAIGYFGSLNRDEVHQRDDCGPFKQRRIISESFSLHLVMPSQELLGNQLRQGFPNVIVVTRAPAFANLPKLKRDTLIGSPPRVYAV